MTAHLQKEVEKLKKKILCLCTVAEESVVKAVKSLSSRDNSLAREVIEYDYEIDKMEVDLEEDCLKILALYQPVAIDLRFIVAVLKINNELERIGDLAVNIAERAVFLIGKEKFAITTDFTEMTAKVKKMLKDSLDSLVNMDKDLAYNVINSDDEVDQINCDIYKNVQREIKGNLDYLESFIHLISFSRHLERIADHATNIAEDVIYMIEGVIVRHKTEEF